MKNCYHSFDLKAAERLLKQGFAYIDVDKRYVEYAEIIVACFKRFTELPLVERQKWLFDIGLVNKPDAGYIRRDDEEAKHFMHHFYMLRDLLAHRNMLYPEFRIFLERMNVVHRYFEERAKEFALAFDVVAPGYDVASRLDNIAASMQSVLRVLQYDHCTVEMQETAEAHEDQSVFTLPIFETHQGLYFREKENLYVPEESKIVIFPGKKLQLITGGKETFEIKNEFRIPKITGGQVKALTHGVVSLPSLYGDDYERSSVVLFTHDPSTTLTPKTKV